MFGEESGEDGGVKKSGSEGSGMWDGADICILFIFLQSNNNNIHLDDDVNDVLPYLMPAQRTECYACSGQPC